MGTDRDILLDIQKAARENAAAIIRIEEHFKFNDL